MAQRAHQLRRSDIRQETDHPTNSVILRYVGPDLGFDNYLYGYPEDTFFAVQLDDVPWPPELEELAEELGIAIDPLPDAVPLRRAIADALVAGAMVDAPHLLEDLGAERDVEWPSWELREAERRHRIAETRVVAQKRVVESDLKLRAAGFKAPRFDAPSLPEPQPQPSPPAPPVSPPAPPTVVVEVPGAASSCTPAPGDACDEVEDAAAYEPGSQTVLRARQAIRLAREQELPQRLPGGMRRRLKKVPPAVYIMHGEIMDPRLDLCAAMTDARAMGRADRETVVVDYDGEWPVVARRFGQDGRTIYKVEDALRRYGVELPRESAPSGA